MPPASTSRSREFSEFTGKPRFKTGAKKSAKRLPPLSPTSQRTRTNMSTKDITSPAATTVTGRKIPAIEPRHQSGQYWQMRGQKFGEAFIVLPAGLIPQDLTDYPVEVWSKIQQTGLSQMPCV